MTAQHKLSHAARTKMSHPTRRLLLREATTCATPIAYFYYWLHKAIVKKRSNNSDVISGVKASVSDGQIQQSRFLFSMISLHITNASVRGQDLTTTNLQLKPKLKDIENEMKTA